MSQIIPIYIPQYISSVDYQPARVQPRILFYNGQVECESFYVKNENAISQEVKNFPYFDNYNVSGSQFPTTGSKSLLFFNEAAAYGEVPTESLYSSYWSKYVSLLYSPRTRLLNASAIIPLADYFKMELNDIVEFRGNYYHLRAINDYNLKNGECDIQLLGPILGDVLPNLFTTTTTTLNPNCEYNTLVVDCSGTTTTSTSTTTTTAAPEYELGDAVDGGYVFYITGSYPNQCGLIAAPSEYAPITFPQINFGCSGTNVSTITDIFAGSTNTQTILTACTQSLIGARYCSDLVHGGKSDWYLPSLDELSELYTNRTYVPGLITITGSFHMTSNQGIDATRAYFINFQNGDVIDFRAKETTDACSLEFPSCNYVIPVRQFGPCPPVVPTTTTSTTSTSTTTSTTSTSTTTSTTTTTTAAPSIPTDGLQFWFDGSDWSGTGDWLASYGNATASLFGVTKLNENGGVLDFQSSSLLEITASGVQPDYSVDYSTSVVLVAKNSGSSALQHGRILNGVGNNWLFGSYADVYPGAWFNGNFVSDTNFGEDNNWRIMAGVQYSQPSASAFINNVYVDGLSGFNGYGPNGLAINKGSFITGTNPNAGEYTYAVVGQILFYDKALSDSELTQIYNVFSGSYF
jgi:hypothetical protein